MKKINVFMVLLYLSCFNIIAQVTDVVTLDDRTWGMDFNGNDLYVAISENIAKIDITDPNPTPIIVVNTEAPLSYIVFHENDLYISDQWFGRITKIDITDPNATQVDVVTGVSGSAGLAFNGNDLYIAIYSGKIVKIDITDPNPIPVDVVTGLNYPEGIVISNNVMYIAELSDDKISKIDLTDPNPIPVDVVTGLDSPVGITLINNELYIAEVEGRKISKIDITDPNPVPINVVSGLNGGPVSTINNGNCLYISEYSGTISKICNLNLSIDEIPTITNNRLIPNPSNHFIQVSNMVGIEKFKIYNNLGQEVGKGNVSQNEKIDIQYLTNGLYYLKFDNGNTLEFIKK